MAKKSYDWVKLKLEFVKSSLSIRDFAEAYGVPYSTFSKKVMREKWSSERNQIGIKLESKSVEKTVEDKSTELAKFEAKSLKAIAVAQDGIINALSVGGKPNEVKALTGALVDLQKVYRLALGASTENQATGSVEDYSVWLKEIHNAKGRD
ncbi:hypothetical protein BMT54_01795 [Pasteurellaceae bacterium 15-036681]|nr:hypothetical protein BMT54_01795 [Pasteurellaceae bacterium 15-036681]